MITIPHTNGVISEKDLSKIPENHVARHSNGTHWIYFITQDEYDAYMLEHFPPTENLEN